MIVNYNKKRRSTNKSNKNHLIKEGKVLPPEEILSELSYKKMSNRSLVQNFQHKRNSLKLNLRKDLEKITKDLEDENL